MSAVTVTGQFTGIINFAMQRSHKMCIRDRLCAVPLHQVRFEGYGRPDSAPVKRHKRPQAPVSVSYTHLDVYKRQVWYLISWLLQWNLDSCKRKIAVIYMYSFYFSASRIQSNNSLLTSDRTRAAFRRLTSFPHRTVFRVCLLYTSIRKLWNIRRWQFPIRTRMNLLSTWKKSMTFPCFFLPSPPSAPLPRPENSFLIFWVPTDAAILWTHKEKKCDMNDNCMLAFLNALKENNTKEWMSANKSCLLYTSRCV